jgi:hypothetical protein
MDEAPRQEHDSLDALEPDEQRRQDVDRIARRRHSPAETREEIGPMPDHAIRHSLDRERQGRGHEHPRIHVMTR